MALTRDKKNQVIEEVKNLLKDSKMTVVAEYKGTPVKAMQSLRRNGQDNGTTIKVVKNRLVLKALESIGADGEIEKSKFSGMLLYAFNSNDEVAPAQVLDNFAKTQPTIEFVGAISAEGKFLNSEEVKSLAKLPSKNEIIAQVIATLESPMNDTLNGLSSGLSGILSGLETSAKE